MATEIITQTNWGSRSKRTSVIALGLVAILAGVAVAYFLTSQKYGGNTAIGGTLTVDATLPLDFSGQPLYPTNAADGGEAAVEQLFTITNNNTVQVKYQMLATCEECIPDPADTPDQANARAEKANQFNHLKVTINTDPPKTCPTLGVDPAQDAAYVANAQKAAADQCKTYLYRGYLKDMTVPVELGTIAAGDSGDYTVNLWLENVNEVQPQGIQNIWEFLVNAKTPVS
jgi:hypothetical protein